jgi:hypothetical protein
MGTNRLRRRRYASADEEASRLVAIRVIVDLADNDEVHDVVAEALLVLGASREELTAATLGGSITGSSRRRPSQSVRRNRDCRSD